MRARCNQKEHRTLLGNEKEQYPPHSKSEEHHTLLGKTAGHSTHPCHDHPKLKGYNGLEKHKIGTSRPQPPDFAAVEYWIVSNRSTDARVSHEGMGLRA